MDNASCFGESGHEDALDKASGGNPRRRKRLAANAAITRRRAGGGRVDEAVEG